MSATTLPAGAIVLDAAGFQGVSDFTPFKEFGASGVSLYLVGRYAVDASCVQAAWLAGLQVQLNWERTPSAYMQGSAGGHAAVAEALPVAERLGWQGESPIVFSATDTGVALGDYVKADAWYTAMVSDMLKANAVGGAYGPAAYLRHLAAQWWWPEDFPLWHWAGDGAKPETWTWAQQMFAQFTIAGVTVDLNRIYKPYPFWSGFPDDPPLPPLEDDVTLDEIVAALTPIIHDQCFKAVTDIMHDPGREVWLQTQAACDAALAELPPGTTVDYQKIDQIIRQALDDLELTISLNTP